MYGAKLTLRLARNRGTNWNFFNRYFSSASSEVDNYHIVLNNRPGTDGTPTAENFRCERTLLPAKDELTDGKLLVKSLYISTDPALRCRMNLDTGVDYTEPWQLNETLDGFEGIGIVEESAHPNYKKGDVIHNLLHWQWKKIFVLDAEAPHSIFLRTIEKKDVEEANLTSYISLLGIAGMTAYIGMKEKGFVKPNSTCVVSGAAGSCGSIAGQVAKNWGSTTVIGICGSDEKCRILTEELGFTAAINYRRENVLERLKKLCPNKIDVYFDNVGGSITENVISLMSDNSHAVLCGEIANYNKDVPYPSPLSPEIEKIMKERNITRDRYLVLDYPEQFTDARDKLIEMYRENKMKTKETITVGFENLGKAFCDMMAGKNIGKQLVKV